MGPSKTPPIPDSVLSLKLEEGDKASTLFRCCQRASRAVGRRGQLLSCDNGQASCLHAANTNDGAGMQDPGNRNRQAGGDHPWGGPTLCSEVAPTPGSGLLEVNGGWNDGRRTMWM